MMICNSKSRRGMNKLKHRCTSVSECKQRASIENGAKIIKKDIEEDEESADDASAEIGKSNAKRGR